MNKKLIPVYILIILIFSIATVNAEENITVADESNSTTEINIQSEIDNNDNNSDNKLSYTVNLLEAQQTNTMQNAIWIRGSDMKNVNFQTLKDSNIDTILLNFAAIDIHGRSTVTQWVANANNYGLNVHIWMQVCYHGSFENPLKNGRINTELLNRDINDAKEFASISGIRGINLDYIRYPGTASRNPGGAAAITHFVTEITKAVKSVNENLIVSASLMPEPSALISSYGQDLSALSEVLDYLIPMVYKGNYKQGSAWITQVTKYFVDNSKKAEVICGLQSYRSDSDLTKLTKTELTKDVDAAAAGGAIGVCIFRYGLTNFIDFKRGEDPTTHIKTSINSEDWEHYYGEKYNFTGTINDENNLPLIGQHVILKITRLSNGLSKEYDVVSDYNGEYSLPINLGIGKYSMEVNYNGAKVGDITYDRANTVTVSLNVLNGNLTNVTLIANKFDEKFNSGANFTGYLYDNETPILGHTVKVKLQRTTNTQSKTYNVVTDYTGKFILSINLSPGEYLAFCTYDGTDKYQSASANTTISVRADIPTEFII